MEPPIKPFPTYDEKAEIVEAKEEYDIIENKLETKVDAEFITDSWLRARSGKQAKMMFLFGAAFTLMEEILEEQNPDDQKDIRVDGYYADFHDLYNHVQIQIDEQIEPNAEFKKWPDKVTDGE